MSSLYVDRRGIELILDGDALAFYEKGARIGTVPIAPLERVYLRGDVRLSSGALGRLGSCGVGVVILSGRRAEPSLLLPCPHNDARTRLAQFSCHANLEKRFLLARWVVRAKLMAQRALLSELAEVRPDKRYPLLKAHELIGGIIGQINHKKDAAALRGAEGAAAAAYFGAFVQIFPSEAKFSGRNRRPPRDPVNATLSLSYTMLHSEATLACYGYGMDPFVGFIHEIDFGRHSFSCDLVEPLRPVVDRFVWRLFADQILRPRDFSIEKDGACLLGKAGRERFYASVDSPLGEARKRLDAMLGCLRRLFLEDSDVDTLPDQL